MTALTTSPALTAAQHARADAIDAVLPQTQCTRCGEPDCRRYAEAIATGHAPINRCPPGGAEGVRRLATITGQAPLPLDPVHGTEGPRRMAVIDEAWCIGCALCTKACPIDCIVGAAKQMHTVIEAQCTGCDLCLPACPVDCISMVDIEAAGPPALPAPTGWAAWSPAQADAARQRYRARNARRAGGDRPKAGARAQGDAVAISPPGYSAISAISEASEASDSDRKRAAIEEALRRARLRRTPAP